MPLVENVRHLLIDEQIIISGNYLLMLIDNEKKERYEY